MPYDFIVLMLVEEFKQIKYQKEDNGILTVTLNWPAKKNALSPLGLLELWYAVDHAEKDNKVKVMLLTGCEEAEAFSSGGYFSYEILKKVPEKYRSEIDLRDITGFGKSQNLRHNLLDAISLKLISDLYFSGTAFNILSEKYPPEEKASASSHPVNIITLTCLSCSA